VLDCGPCGAGPSPNPNQILLTGGAYVMSLTNGSVTRDYIIVPDSVDENDVPHNELDGVALGFSVVAPADPYYRTNGGVLARDAACGYASALNGHAPGDDPCFQDDASAVVPIKTTAQDGETVGGQMTWNGLGFVRRAVDVPQHVVVSTLLLGDVGIKYVETEHVGIGVAIPDTHAGDVTLSSDIEFGAPLIDLSGRPLWNRDGVSVTLSAAKVTTRPHLETALGMEKGDLKHLRVVLDDALDVQLAVTLGASVSYEKQIDKDLFVFSKTLPPQIIGGVPLVETLRFAIHGHCHVSLSTKTSVTAGVALHESVRLGIEYTPEGGWTNLSSVAEPTVVPTLSVTDASGSATFACDLTPKFSFLFYDLAGPYLSITPSAAFYVSPSKRSGELLDLQLDADFRGVLGVDTNGSIPFVGSLLTITQMQNAHLSLFDFHLSGVATGSVP
jgi:hypothetical protein